MHTRSLLLLLLILSPALAMAQGEHELIRDLLYGSGKINAVIAVVTVLFCGLFIWLFMQDRRLKRMEKELRK